MPWTAKQFKEHHNNKLTANQAAEAARQANALIKKGVKESEAIAIANKNAEKPKYKKTI
jgi:uncharacterized protein YdaT